MEMRGQTTCSFSTGVGRDECQEKVNSASLLFRGSLWIHIGSVLREEHSLQLQYKCSSLLETLKNAAVETIYQLSQQAQASQVDMWANYHTMWTNVNKLWVSLNNVGKNKILKPSNVLPFPRKRNLWESRFQGRIIHNGSLESQPCMSFKIPINNFK